MLDNQYIPWPTSHTFHDRQLIHVYLNQHKATHTQHDRQPIQSCHVRQPIHTTADNPYMSRSTTQSHHGRQSIHVTAQNPVTAKNPHVTHPDRQPYRCGEKQPVCTNSGRGCQTQEHASPLSRLPLSDNASISSFRLARERARIDGIDTPTSEKHAGSRSSPHRSRTPTVPPPPPQKCLISVSLESGQDDFTIMGSKYWPMRSVVHV